jgi:hypothetical protein
LEVANDGQAYEILDTDSYPWFLKIVVLARLKNCFFTSIQVIYNSEGANKFKNQH